MGSVRGSDLSSECNTCVRQNLTASVIRERAQDVDWSVTYVAHSLLSELDRISKSVQFDTSDQHLAGGIALLIHNSGGTKSDYHASRRFVKTRKLADLDSRTTDSYVTKVVNILFDCYP